MVRSVVRMSVATEINGTSSGEDGSGIGVRNLVSQLTFLALIYKVELLEL